MAEQPPPQVHPDESELVREFLSDLAAALHVLYLPSDVVASRVAAAARGLGRVIDVFVLQSAVFLQSARGGGAYFAATKFSPRYDLDRLHRVERLSENVADGHLSLHDARAELDRILAAPPRYPKPIAVLGCVLYGAAVAARIGGGPVEIFVAALVGLLTGAILFGTTGEPELDLQKGFFGALAGTLAAFLLGLVLPPFDTGRAVFGGIALLAPAMTVTLAAYELASEKAAEAGVVRLVYGLLRFVMLGAGALAAVHLWKPFGPAPAPVEAVPLPFPAVAVAVAIGGVGLAACLRARRSEVPWIIGAVLLAWGVQSATQLAVGGRGSPFLAAFAVAIVGSLYGRLPHKVPATILFPAVLQLVPGFLGSQAVVGALRPDGVATQATLFDVQLQIVQLGLGLIAGAVAARRFRARSRPAHRVLRAEPRPAQ